jgi:hypothetical protein
MEESHEPPVPFSRTLVGVGVIPHSSHSELYETILKSMYPTDLKVAQLLIANTFVTLKKSCYYKNRAKLKS